jgi:protein-tyrosine phosphatase
MKTETDPQRRLPVKGGYNFRDLGGYRTKDGKTVKWGKLLRGDEMNALTDEDISYFARMPLVSIVDFRSEKEAAQIADRNPPSIKDNYNLAIDSGKLVGEEANEPQNITARQANRFMRDIYASLVTDEHCINMYRRFFAILRDGSSAPLLFHCTAGKDRTGVAAALILYALNADDETVMRDYLLTNVYLESKYTGLSAKYPALKEIFSAKEEYLDLALNLINEKHGSVERYLKNTLNADTAKMRSLYLD